MSGAAVAALVIVAVLALVAGAAFLYDTYGSTPLPRPTKGTPKANTALEFQILAPKTPPKPPRPPTKRRPKLDLNFAPDGIEIGPHTTNLNARCRLTGRTIADCTCTKHKEK